MTGRTGKRAVDCGDYSQLYDYVADGLRDLDEENIPFPYDGDEQDPGVENLGPGELEALLMAISPGYSEEK